VQGQTSVEAPVLKEKEQQNAQVGPRIKVSSLVFRESEDQITA